jgi:hypothetical protein
VQFDRPPNVLVLIRYILYNNRVLKFARMQTNVFVTPLVSFATGAVVDAAIQHFED